MVGKNNTEIVTVKVDAEFESLDKKEELLNVFANKNTIEICDGDAEIELLSLDDSLSFDGSIVVQLLINFSVGILSSVIGNYIFGLCNGAKKLSLDNRRTRVVEKNIIKEVETIKTKSGNKQDIKITKTTKTIKTKEK